MNFAERNMNFFSIFGPNIVNTQTSTNRTDTNDRNSNRDLFSNIFSTEMNEIVQHLLQGSSNPPLNNNTDEEEPTANATTQTEATPLSTGDEETIFFENIPINPNPTRMSFSQLNEQTSLQVKTAEEEYQCVICHNIIEDNTIYRKINSCGHAFNTNCIDEWFNNNTTCPTCRLNLIPPPNVSRGTRRTSTSFTLPIYSVRYV